MTRRWLIPIAAGCLALVVLVLGTVTWLVLFPDPDPPGRSDAIVMLGGPDLKPRVAALDHLMALGAAPTAVVSTGGAHSRGKPSECQRSYPVICFQPDPFTTKGEVDFVREVAQQRGWRSVQVLTFRPHVSRTQWLFGKCTDLDVRVIEVDSPLRLQDVIHHVGGWLKAMARPEC